MNQTIIGQPLTLLTELFLVLDLIIAILVNEKYQNVVQIYLKHLCLLNTVLVHGIYVLQMQL